MCCGCQAKLESVYHLICVFYYLLLQDSYLLIYYPSLYDNMYFKTVVIRDYQTFFPKILGMLLTLA